MSSGAKPVSWIIMKKRSGRQPAVLADIDTNLRHGRRHRGTLYWIEQIRPSGATCASFAFMAPLKSESSP